MKTIIIIVTVTLIGLYAIGKATSKALTSPKGIQTALDNKNNKQNYPIGKPVDFEKSLMKFKDLSKQELEQILEEESLNLHEVSNALLVLANVHFQKEDTETGIPLLESAAYDYHNPLAMVTLAKANFHGYEESPEGTISRLIKDLEKAFYLVNRAIQTAGELEKLTGEKFALNRTIAGGLGLLDSYNLGEIKKEFNQNEHSERISKLVDKDVAEFVQMYALK